MECSPKSIFRIASERWLCIFISSVWNIFRNTFYTVSSSSSLEVLLFPCAIPREGKESTSSLQLLKPAYQTVLVLSPAERALALLIWGLPTTIMELTIYFRKNKILDKQTVTNLTVVHLTSVAVRSECKYAKNNSCCTQLMSTKRPPGAIDLFSTPLLFLFVLYTHCIPSCFQSRFSSPRVTISYLIICSRVIYTLFIFNCCFFPSNIEVIQQEALHPNVQCSRIRYSSYAYFSSHDLDLGMVFSANHFCE